MESVSKPATQVKDEALASIFKMFDRDGDGKISGQEFKAVMSSLVDKLSDADADRMFREADSDHDGSISFEEFSKMILPQP
jgi:Ca2+-binding EF-hand superfamily protein